ncbi:bifunctional 5,10-methylenetetrahydrofolate dehydrogenase/5,10-methenyltetrahydrofolate cyclohydrolase [Spiroplasma endosymbiont of Crioceris asparagi]|uniref:bifunctional 5,10-methylenetetrahydrofolate dehydrogenase/5,10-methenyltetrahydrofolate cyclohydrolase n=1 Tax=Spiroplasma endosymbiont of Crioceris asparagi TaxID=3066286 RepID=UPI0030CECEB4
MAKIINGKEISEKLLLEIKENIIKNNLNIKLVVIQVGDIEASNKYIKYKTNACKNVGINLELIKYDANVKQEDIINEIHKLNQDNSVNGIMTQLPLPKHIDVNAVIESISPVKDADGFTKSTLGAIMLGECLNPPATPKGIIKLLEEYNIDVVGKNITIIGRSNIVGKPLANMLINKSATVTVCHTKTINPNEKIKSADIIISAAGALNIVNKNNIGENQIVIDVGTNFVDGKLYGDVNFDEVENKTKLISKAIGGVGPMTIWGLIDNVYKLALKQKTA